MFCIVQIKLAKFVNLKEMFLDITERLRKFQLNLFSCFSEEFCPKFATIWNFPELYFIPRIILFCIFLVKIAHWEFVFSFSIAVKSL